MEYTNGKLSPVLGVHNIQVMRANRTHPPTVGQIKGWTYNHQPMLAHWEGTFYLQYVSDPVDEHGPPGRTMLVTSKDGYHWSRPKIVFPTYRIPDGTKKNGSVAHDLGSV